VAANTALRALHMLIDQGLLEARPRRGFWICEEKAKAASYAYLMSTQNIYAGFDALYKTLMQEFRACAGSRGDHFTTIVLNPGDEAHTIRQHGLSRVNGLILDTPNDHLIDCARKHGVSAVLIDDEDSQRRVNTVVQSNFEGGELAARHLQAGGCRRIAWFGKALDHHHARARYGGALAALVEKGSAFSDQRFLPLDVRQAAFDLERAARSMLEQRPDAVLALWRPMAAAVAAAARDLNLKIGSDFQLVGWTCAELYDSSYAPLFDGPAPPAIVWSAHKMAEAALDRLRTAFAQTSSDAVIAHIPVSIRIHADAIGAPPVAEALQISS
jgi:hypothetical protein